MRKVFAVILLFAPGITWAANYTSSTTGDWNNVWTWGGSGIPGDGDTATIAAGITVTCSTGETCIVGTSPASTGTTALTVNGTLNVWGTLVIRGPVSYAHIIFQAGSVIAPDSSRAASPATTTYAWTAQGSSSTVTCSGTSASHVRVWSNPGGGNGHFYTKSGNIPPTWTCKCADFVSIGDSVNDGVDAGKNSAFLNVTFDWDYGANQCSATATSGRVYLNPGTSAFDIEDSKFCQLAGASSLVIQSSNSTPTGARKLYRNVFVKKPHLSPVGLDAQDDVFLNGWTNDDYGASIPWTNWNGGFIRNDQTMNGQLFFGSMSNVFFFWESSAAPSYTGTVTAATSTTLHDASQNWTTNIFRKGTVIYYVEIMSGTGVGQRRIISANTANTLTIPWRWDVTPDSTSTYQIMQGVYNNHGLEPYLGHNVTLDHILFQCGSCDDQGDSVLHMDGPTSTYTVQYSIVLPNEMGDTSGVLATNFGNGKAQGAQYFLHNTIFAGAESPLSVTEGGKGYTGSIAAYLNNIGSRDPSRTYWGDGGDGPGYQMTAGSSGCSIGTTTLDIVTEADYNDGWGLQADGLAGNGYNVHLDYTPGVHDLHEDPQFVGCGSLRSIYNCTFWNWAATPACGSTAVTMTGLIADGEVCLERDPSLARTSLQPWIEAGYAPTNPDLHEAASDGSDIGAVPYQTQ